MAKRSYIQSIRTKQSSAYSANRISAPALHAIDGSSKREISRSSHPALKSWSPSRSGVSIGQLDRAAEERMSGGWSRLRNPICSVCYVQKALNGACNCN